MEYLPSKEGVDDEGGGVAVQNWLESRKIGD
jgi:hypothetical protein